MTLTSSTLLLIDNQDALDLIKSGQINNHTKYIDIKFRHVCDQEDQGTILSRHVATQEQIAVRDVQSGSGVTRNGAELLRSRRELTTKVREQPWSQLVRCASIYCRTCGCVFQED